MSTLPKFRTLLRHKKHLKGNGDASPYSFIIYKPTDVDWSDAHRFYESKIIDTDVDFSNLAIFLKNQMEAQMSNFHFLQVFAFNPIFYLSYFSW